MAPTAVIVQQVAVPPARPTPVSSTATASTTTIPSIAVAAPALLLLLDSRQAPRNGPVVTAAPAISVPGPGTPTAPPAPTASTTSATRATTRATTRAPTTPGAPQVLADDGGRILNVLALGLGQVDEGRVGQGLEKVQRVLRHLDGVAAFGPGSHYFFYLNKGGVKSQAQVPNVNGKGVHFVILEGGHSFQ